MVAIKFHRNHKKLNHHLKVHSASASQDSLDQKCSQKTAPWGVAISQTNTEGEVLAWLQN